MSQKQVHSTSMYNCNCFNIQDKICMYQDFLYKQPPKFLQPCACAVIGSIILGSILNKSQKSEFFGGSGFLV